MNNESNLHNSNSNRPRPTIIDCDSPSASPRDQFTTPPSLTSSPPSGHAAFARQPTSGSLDMSSSSVARPHLVHPTARAASSVALGSKYNAQNSRSSPREHPGSSSSTNFAGTPWSATSARSETSPFVAGTPWSASTATSGGTFEAGDSSAMSYVPTPMRSEAQTAKERAPWNTETTSVSPGQTPHALHGSNSYHNTPSPGSNNSGSHSGNHRLDSYGASAHHRGMVAVSSGASPDSSAGLLASPGAAGPVAAAPGAPPPPPEISRTGLPRVSPNVVGTHMIEDETGVPVEEIRLWTGVKLRKPDGRNMLGKTIVIQPPNQQQRQQRKLNPHRKQVQRSGSQGSHRQNQGHPIGVKKHSPKSVNPQAGTPPSAGSTPSTGSSGLRSILPVGKLVSRPPAQNGNNHNSAQ